MRKKRSQRIKHCVVISDLHFGCSFALCPSDGITLDSGVVYKPSKLQKVLWKWWEIFWNQWLPSKIGSDPFCLVINGDVLEGVHHNVVTTISNNMDDQTTIAKRVLVPIFKRAEKVFIVRGTESHSGKSSQEEERLATELGATPITKNSTTSYELWMDLNGKIIHFCHHIGSFLAHSESTGLMREMIESVAELGRWSKVIPDVIVRSHRHSFCEVSIPKKDGKIIGIVTPAWQLKTPFTFKLARSKMSLPQIGGVLISVIDGDVLVSSFVRGLSQSNNIVYV